MVVWLGVISFVKIIVIMCREQKLSYLRYYVIVTTLCCKYGIQ